MPEVSSCLRVADSRQLGAAADLTSLERALHLLASSFYHWWGAHKGRHTVELAVVGSQ